MKHPKLTVEKRTVLGKKVKSLRRDGVLPANVYGKGLSSVAVQMPQVDFDAVHKEVGETGLIDLEFDGKTHPVLVKNLQLAYPSHQPLHVDFYQVNLKEKVKTMVPIVLEGEAKAVTEKVGTLLQTLNEVEVEALPDKLPENITVNIEHLAAIDEQMSVEDLKAPEGVAILTDPAQIVVKIAELVAPEPEPEPEAEAAEGAAEGEAPAEGAEEKSEAAEPAEEKAE
jgi:large subunit ribosomal protein L25